MTRHGAATLTVCAALLAGVAGCADVPARLGPASGEMACNGPCTWWMSLGTEPKDEAPPAAALRPAEPVGDIVAMPTRVAGRLPRLRAEKAVRTSKSPIVTARIASPVTAAPAPQTVEAPAVQPQAAHPAKSGWGLPIPGSVPVQPETWGPLR